LGVLFPKIYLDQNPSSAQNPFIMSIFSYLQSVQGEVPKSIFDRGVRLYLEGGVLSHRNLLLDNWREYKVYGTEVYLVRIPLLHFLLARSKFSQADQTMNEFANCTCPYFPEFGLCKHIVAVCHDLEKEFFDIRGKQKLDQKVEESILGSIFAVEQQSKQRKLLAHLDTFFSQSRQQNIFWWEQFIFDFQKNKIDYGDFQSQITGYFVDQLRQYENEKKSLYLILTALKLDGSRWWQFGLDLLPSLTRRQQLRFWSEIWKLRFAVLTKPFDHLINASVRALEESDKGEILNQLKEDFEGQSEIWLDFVLSSVYTSFLEENLNHFDSELLLDICHLIPEQRENIEIRILNQVKTWSDFLPVGDYSELEKIMTKWRILGYSDYFDEAMKYITIQHKKKPKLMSFLRGLK
jgi:SWIM zinc finger